MKLLDTVKSIETLPEISRLSMSSSVDCCLLLLKKTWSHQAVKVTNVKMVLNDIHITIMDTLVVVLSRFLCSDLVLAR